MSRRSAEGKPMNMLRFPERKIGIAQGDSHSLISHNGQTAAPTIQDALSRLRAENEELRAKAIDLVLQIQTLRENNQSA
jgi:hypothetical protein